MYFLLWGSVRLYFLLVFLRYSLQIGDSGSQTLTKATLSAMLTSSWLHRTRLLWMQRKISFGTLRFPWRFLFLRGVFCATGYQQKQIWFLEASYQQILSTAWQAAERLDRPNTYSSPATRSVLCGLSYALGLAFLRWTLILFQITLSSLPIQRVVFVHAVHFCNSSGLLARGLCGVREIIDCSEVQQIPYNNFWTRSRLSTPLGGCRRQILL
jgi:hypothetical protein